VVEEAAEIEVLVLNERPDQAELVRKRSDKVVP